MKKISLLILLTISACGGPRGGKISADQEPAVMRCSDFKVQNECASLSRHTPKCMWMSNTCIPESRILRNLMGSGQRWKADLSKKDQALGLNVALEWHKICGVAKKVGRLQDLTIYISEISLEFVRGSDKVNLAFDCLADSASPYSFTYSGKEENGILLLTLDAQGARVDGEYERHPINILDFFTKASWLFDESSSSMVAISLYEVIYGTNPKTTPLNSKAEFDAVLKYMRDTPGTNATKDIKGTSLIFKRDY